MATSRKKKGKNSTESEAVVLLGRPGNNVKVGIVGLPNVGKSSFFNLMSKLNVPAENFPFCTIDPNLSRVPVPDQRFNFLVKSFTPKSEVPAVLGVTDIAGLVRGANEGAGLGNAFLSHIRATDAIYHMVRAFENKNVSHVEDSVDPIRDMEIIHDELRLKDQSAVAGVLEPMAKLVQRGVGGKEKKFEHDTLVKVQAVLEEGRDVRAASWSNNEILILNQYQFLTAKPMVYLVNLTKKGYYKRASKWLGKIAEWVAARGLQEPVLPFSVAYEQARFDLEVSGDTEGLQKFIADTNGVKSALPRIIRTGYKTLRLVHFFTVGEDEVRAWSIRDGTLAPKAAGVIHTDFEHGFICADVVPFVDFKATGSEAAARKAGKLKQQGKQYAVQDGDIIHFKFNN